MSRGREFTMALIAMATLVQGCVSPPRSDPQFATVWGFVRVASEKPSNSGETDEAGDQIPARNVLDESLTPESGIAFVSLSSVEISKPSPTQLTIRETRGELALDPQIVSAHPRAGLRIRNSTSVTQTISAPDLDWVKQIEPGGIASFEHPTSGEIGLQVLRDPAESVVSARVWFVEGLRIEVGASGRYAINGLRPGHYGIQAWYPRLPPSPVKEFEVAVGGVERVDIEIGLDATNPRSESGD